MVTEPYNNVSKTKLILLDANFLLVPVIYRIDLISELYRLLSTPFKIVVLSGIIDELKIKYKSLKEGKKRKEILFAMNFAKQFEIIDWPKKEYTDMDDAIIDFALMHDAIIATNDKQLRKKLKQQGIPTIFVRKRKYLKLEGYE